MKISFFFSTLFFLFSCSNSVSYTAVSDGFYRDRTGQLFILTTQIEELSNSIWEFREAASDLGDKMTISAPFYRAVPNIDLETYEVLGGLGYYAKDNQHVYQIIDMTDGRHIHIIEEADPATFESLGDRLGKDKNFVFENGLIQEGLNPDSIFAIKPF